MTASTGDALSPNHDARPADARIALLVLHFTGMRSAAAALERLSDPAARVSAHYLIDEDGMVSSLVPEARRAWHAGVSAWGHIDDVNSRSIGIELVNPGHEWGYRPFPEAQITALIDLGRGICRRHGLAPHQVVGHSDIAPARKTDPGELFPWAHLAGHGLGVWPPADAAEPASADFGNAPPDREAALGLLRRIGYRFDLPATKAHHVIAAFQRHWRPARVDGRLDRNTQHRIAAVARLLGD